MGTLRRRTGWPALLAAAVTAGGCAWDTAQSTTDAHSDLARSILDVYGVIAWAAVGIAAVVATVLAWVLLRYRARAGAALPRQTHGHTGLEIGWTVAPAIVILVIAIPTVRVVFQTQAPPPADALQVTVRGWQWWWEFRYPSLGVVTANELHLPAGRPAVLRLEGPDVIHSFWVPKLGGKRDVVPGRVNSIVLTPDRPGEYWGQCAELCGVSHANMGLRVVVEPPEDFARWAAAQRAPAAEPPAAAAGGREIFRRSACAGCHAIRGVSAGALGPDLTHFGSRRTLAAGLLPNTAGNVMAWLRDPQRIKPGARMPSLGLSEAEARTLALYLTSLR